jgi:hypothetical protein
MGYKTDVLRVLTCPGGYRGLFPGGSYPHHTGKITICQPKTDPVLIFFIKKVSDTIFPVDLHTSRGYTCVVGLDYSSASRQLTSLTCSNRAM